MKNDSKITVEEFIKKVNTKKDNKHLDLSSDEDLSIAIMNLISIEEHFFFTGKKTGKDKYFDLLTSVREIRKGLLLKIVKQPEGEIWCISKHLLASSMRLIEVGNKQYAQGNTKEALDLYQKGYDLYNLFWGLNLNLIDVSKIKKIDEGAISKTDKDKKGFLGKLGVMVKKVVDCCIE